LLGFIAGTPDDGGGLALERASLALGEVRRTKSEARRPLSTPVERLVVRDIPANLAALRSAAADLQSAGVIQALDLVEGDSFEASVTLAATDQRPDTARA
jgi:valyl-tRNA synthetase